MEFAKGVMSANLVLKEETEDERKCLGEIWLISKELFSRVQMFFCVKVHRSLAIKEVHEFDTSNDCQTAVDISVPQMRGLSDPKHAHTEKDQTIIHVVLLLNEAIDHLNYRIDDYYPNSKNRVY